MLLRRLLHPLPLVLIVLFVAVAVADLVQKLGEETPPSPEVMGSEVVRFEAVEPVIDLRANRGDQSIETAPMPVFAAGQWSPSEASGVWAKGSVAEFSIGLATGGHRALVLDCMPAPGKRSVRTLRLTVNGIDCGTTAVQRGWQRSRLTLPDGAIRSGLNTFVLSFPDRESAKRVRRALVIRRLGLFFDPDAGVEDIEIPLPASLDVDTERISLRRSGTLEIPILLEDRTDALQLRYRFAAGAGRIEVEVVQAKAGPGGGDAALLQAASAEEMASGRIRVPLHGRRGGYLLRIRADVPGGDNRLLISSLRLVEEGDPTRRPWAANRDPN